MLKILKIYFILITNIEIYCSAVDLVAYISQNGLHGEIHFQQANKTVIAIQSKLETTLQFPDQVWSWGIHEFPVEYTDINSNDRCAVKNIGQNLISFDEDLGYLTLPGNETSSWLKEMKLTGKSGIWGRSLVLWNANDRICATITTVDNTIEHMAEARFHSLIAGSIFFRWLASSIEMDNSDTLIFSNLYHVQQAKNFSNYKLYTEHSWKIYVTDIFENDHHRSEENCNFLQSVFDPMDLGVNNGIGDIDSRVGKVKASTNALKQQQRMMFRDEKLLLLPSDLTIPHRTLYLVLFDHSHPDNFLACAQIRHVKPLLYKTYINANGIKGDIIFTQRSPFDPTFLNFTISSASNDREANREYAADLAAIRIHNLPPEPQKIANFDYCKTAGPVFNPSDIENDKIPPPGYGTQDQYPLGDLSGKLQGRNKDYPHNYILPGTPELNGIYWDVFLPLQGANSIAHRGLILYQYNRTNLLNLTEMQSACSTILHYTKNGLIQKSMISAEILFRYPIVGRILLRQPKDEHWLDTTIIFEYLIHADGSTQNNSDSHRWAIHDEAPGKDFYDWQNRCISTGEIYNPYKINIGSETKDNIEDYCKSWLPNMCRLGDLHNRLGKISIAGRKADSTFISRKIFTDSNLPLSGRHNVFGKSFVIYDDFGPVARGERLACSIISGHFRRKAVAKEWYPNGSPLTVKGKIEIVQQSEYDISNIDIELKGLLQTSGYHVHMTPVEANLAFPCEDSSLYGHWNPRNINPKTSPLPGHGSSDQYELGDLSGKFGTLNDYTQFENYYNDSNLPLFGYESILGRSIVIHKKEKNVRWACSSIERGYSPSESREIRAIASFHNPIGYAYGYLRMTQLIHNDGSSSDTVIEINLRHPGKNDRNKTRNHDWQVFVNPVGVDATVKQTVTRCVAGGYVWNPFYTQLADPLNTELYKQECGPDNPLRCYVGDVSSRIGTLDLTSHRIVISDPNLPLEGLVSAFGRSVVIFGPERSTERYACANIEPDHNIIKFINLKKPPRFVVAQFLEELREVLGIPEWMLDVDARKTKTLHGGSCVQMIMHFKGPKAHQLELDLSKLLSSGRLEQPTLYIPGYVNQKRKFNISYKTCGVRDPTEKKKKNRNPFYTSHTNSDRPKIIHILFYSLIILIIKLYQ